MHGSDPQVTEEFTFAVQQTSKCCFQVDNCIDQQPDSATAAWSQQLTARSQIRELLGPCSCRTVRLLVNFVVHF